MNPLNYNSPQEVISGILEKKMCKQFLTNLDKAKITGISLTLYMPLTQHQLHGLSAPPLPLVQRH